MANLEKYVQVAALATALSACENGEDVRLSAEECGKRMLATVSPNVKDVDNDNFIDRYTGTDLKGQSVFEFEWNGADHQLDLTRTPHMVDGAAIMVDAYTPDPDFAVRTSAAVKTLGQETSILKDEEIESRPLYLNSSFGADDLELPSKVFGVAYDLGDGWSLDGVTLNAIQSDKDCKVSYGGIYSYSFAENRNGGWDVQLTQ